MMMMDDDDAATTTTTTYQLTYLTNFTFLAMCFLRHPNVWIITKTCFTNEWEFGLLPFLLTCILLN